MAYQNIYCDASYTSFWASIDTAIQLFRKAALLVAQDGGFSYPEQEEQAAKKYMQYIRSTLA